MSTKINWKLAHNVIMIRLLSRTFRLPSVAVALGVTTNVLRGVYFRLGISVNLNLDSAKPGDILQYMKEHKLGSLALINESDEWVPAPHAPKERRSGVEMTTTEGLEHLLAGTAKDKPSDPLPPKEKPTLVRPAPRKQGSAKSSLRESTTTQTVVTTTFGSSALAVSFQPEVVMEKEQVEAPKLKAVEQPAVPAPVEMIEEDFAQVDDDADAFAERRSQLKNLWLSVKEIDELRSDSCRTPLWGMRLTTKAAEPNGSAIERVVPLGAARPQDMPKYKIKYKIEDDDPTRFYCGATVTDHGAPVCSMCRKLLSVPTRADDNRRRDDSVRQKLQDRINAQAANRPASRPPM